MSENALVRVERICVELATTGQPITFTAVAEQAQIGRATLYRDKQLRAVVDEHRTRQTERPHPDRSRHRGRAPSHRGRGARRHRHQTRRTTAPPSPQSTAPTMNHSDLDRHQLGRD